MIRPLLRRAPLVPLSLLLATAVWTGCPGDEEDQSTDGDGDGFKEGEDCDDNDDLTYPGAEELCDGIDNDCDSLVPEEELDNDGDGLADCEGDCDDGDAEVNPGATEICDGIDNDCSGQVDGDDAIDADTFYADGDGDGYGNPEVSALACELPNGHVEDNTDCDDQATAVHPDADEQCNGIDDDCDTFIDEDDAVDAPDWYLDGDGDGYGDAGMTASACSQPSGYVDNADDCEDGNALINPDAAEICDGVDNDCSGQVDGDDAADATSYFGDTDGDGYGDFADMVTGCAQPSGYVELGGDCDDANPTVNPGAEEWCGNGVDENCDGTADEVCLDHCGNVTTDTTWQSGWVHVISCDIYVQGGNAPELTVADGAVVRFAPGVNLYVGYSNFGSLRVEGTTQGVLFGSQEQVAAPGDWDGVYIGYYDSGSDLTGLTVEHGGGNGEGNIWVNHANPDLSECVSRYSAAHGLYADGGSYPNIQDSSFVDNTEDGIHITGGNGLDTTGPATFTGNTLSGNGGYAMTLPASAVGELDAATSTFTGNTEDRVRVLADTLVVDATWQNIDVPLFIDDDVYVQGGATPRLIIEDGATLEFDHNVDLYVGFSNYGELEVQGWTTGVRFTAADPSPQAGDWNGLYLGYYDSGSSLWGLTVEYGGGNGYGTIWASHADPELNGCIVRFSDQHGLYADGGATPRIESSSFTANAGDGVHVVSGSGLASVGPPTFAGNALTSNGGYAITVPADSVGEIDSTTTVFGNTENFVRVLAGTLGEDVTWQAQAVPYFIDGDVYVQGASAPRLTVADGADLRFDHDTDLYIGHSNLGSLEVQGTGIGVRFSAADPSPQPGDWNGLYIGYYDNGSELTGLTVEYGGANGNGGIWTSHADVELTACEVAYSASNGLYADGGSNLEIVSSSFHDNTEDGVLLVAGNSLDHVVSPSFAFNNASNNGGYAMTVPASSVGEIDGGSCLFSGNTQNAIRILADTVSEDATWLAQAVPYFVDGDVYVQGGNTPHLVLEAGVELRFDHGVDFYVAHSSQGSLETQGTVGDPVVFTSGDLNPAYGDWSGLYLGYYCDAAATDLVGLVAEYGGNNGSGNIWFSACDGSLTDSVVQYSSTYGVYMDGGAAPTLTNVTYVDNLSGDTN